MCGNMCDFGSANRDEGGKQGQNQKGLLTIDRSIKKDAFYLYKAYWSKESFVKLAGSRFVHRHKEKNAITVLSNLEKLELYVNNHLIAQSSNILPMTTFNDIPLLMGKKYHSRQRILQTWYCIPRCDDFISRKR